MPSFEKQVADLRNYLLKFARLQLRNNSWAEDAVSETIVAALSKPHTFRNRSQLQTWLVGILKHKIVDIIRRHRRELRQPGKREGTSDNHLESLNFNAKGKFSQPPFDWGNPEQQFSSR